MRFRLRNGCHSETLLEQGAARGLEEALAKGLAKWKAEILLRQARIKFGDVPSPRVSEAQAADVASLDRWLDAVVDADTLEEVFDPLRHD